MRKFMLSIAAAAICGAATFAAVFLLVPKIAIGVPDFIWIAANMIIACGAAFLIFRKLLPTNPVFVLLSPVFQIALLFIFAKSISYSFGYDIDSGFGDLAFFGGYALPWIIGTTAAQYMTLLISGKLCKGKELER